MNSARSVVVLVIAMLLSACASTGISPQDRQSLRRVYIAPIVLPETPFIFKPGAGGALLLAGPIGFALANAGSDLPTAYRNLLAQNGIDIAEGIRAEFRTQLLRKRIEVVSNENEADATLAVDVRQYGMTGDILSDDRYPQLIASVTLARRNGDVIWKQLMAAHIAPEVGKQVNARPLADYFNDRALLESRIKQVNQILISLALKTL